MYIGHMIYRILGNVLCDPDPKISVKGRIIYFLVYASLPKPLDIELKTLKVHMSYKIEGNGQHFMLL